MNLPFIRTAYNYDREASSDESGLKCLDPSLAQQNMRDESDINTIVKRFNLTGELPSGISVPQYGDFLEVTDYHTAMNLVSAADAAFMAMPADIRARFNNDPGLFVDFVSDEKNREEAEGLGLLVTKGSLDQSGYRTGEEASPKGAAVVDNPTS